MRLLPDSAVRPRVGAPELVSLAAGGEADKPQTDAGSSAIDSTANAPDVAGHNVIAVNKP